MGHIDFMVALLEALAEPNRFQIVEYLKDGPHTVSELVTHLHISQPQVSKHLHVLSEVGIVDRKIQSHFRIYFLRPEPFDEFSAWVSTFHETWNPRLDKLEEVLGELKVAESEEAKRP